MFMIIHFGVVACVNGAYQFIFLSTSFSVEIKTIAQVATSLFMFAWDSFVVPSAAGSISSVRLNNVDLCLLKHWCFSVSNLIVPVVVTMTVNSLCFLFLIIPVSSITESFFYNIATFHECVTINITTTSSSQDQFHPQPQLITQCVDYTPTVTVVEQFFPPFTYSFQCGSAVLTTYIPVLIYSLSLEIAWLFLRPFLFVLVDNSVVVTSQSYVYSVKSFLSPQWTQNKASTFVAGMMKYVLVMLTFGLSSPPLTAVVMATAMIHYVSSLLLLKRQLSSDAPTLKVTVERNIKLEEATVDLWKAPYWCVWSSVCLSSVFWGLLVFDMIGDTVVHHPARALWGPLLLLSVPVLLIVIRKIGKHGRIPLFSNELDVDDRNMVVESRPDLQLTSNPVLRDSSLA